MVGRVLLAVAIYLLTLPLNGCTVTRYVPVERRVEVERIERDTIVQTELKREVVIVRTSVDTTATAETSYAKATARVDSCGLDLRIENKRRSIKMPSKVVEIIKTDSVPYPVEVYVPQKIVKIPTFHRIMTWIGISAVIFIFLQLTKRRIF